MGLTISTLRDGDRGVSPGASIESHSLDSKNKGPNSGRLSQLSSRRGSLDSSKIVYLSIPVNGPETIVSNPMGDLHHRMIDFRILNADDFHSIGVSINNSNKYPVYMKKSEIDSGNNKSSSNFRCSTPIW